MLAQDVIKGKVIKKGNYPAAFGGWIVTKNIHKAETGRLNKKFAKVSDKGMVSKFLALNIS